MNSKTFSQKSADVTRKWVVIDAASAPLGRVAVVIAKHLTGKYKPTYTPHVDAGDYVVVINAAQVVVTGNKEISKTYYRHSGYPGGIKSKNLKELREKNPEKVVVEAVKGMVPKNKLSAERMKRLRIFAGSEHTHTAQTPQKVEVQ
jgi:large subunit ribosomal protein L13